MVAQYLITPQVLKQIEDTILHSDNKLTQLAGVKIGFLAERHVRLEMPLGDIHVNHVGTAYAVSMLMLMEMTGASLIRASYGFTYVPIIKKIDVSFLKPTSKTLVCELQITVLEACEKIDFIETHGKGNFVLPIQLYDSGNEIVAEANVVFYLLSAEQEK